jgi:hypothetical protein
MFTAMVDWRDGFEETNPKIKDCFHLKSPESKMRTPVNARIQLQPD